MVRPISGFTYEPMNDKPFEHRCRWGTVFTGTRCDLKTPVNVDVTMSESPNDERATRIKSDYAEFAAWHAICIHPHLNGFSGYDCITFVESSDT